MKNINLNLKNNETIYINRKKWENNLIISTDTEKSFNKI